MILPILPSISMKFWPNQYISFKVVCVEGLQELKMKELKMKDLERHYNQSGHPPRQLLNPPISASNGRNELGEKI